MHARWSDRDELYIEHADSFAKHLGRVFLKIYSRNRKLSTNILKNYQCSSGLFVFLLHCKPVCKQVTPTLWSHIRKRLKCICDNFQLAIFVFPRLWRFMKHYPSNWRVDIGIKYYISIELQNVHMRIYIYIKATNLQDLKVSTYLRWIFKIKNPPNWRVA